MLRPRPAIVLAIVLSPAVANAQPGRRFALSYQGAASCPSESELLAEVQRRAPHAVPVAVGLSEVNAGLRVTAMAERYRGTIDIDSNEGPTHREVEAAECAEVMRALALILAMALDPEASAVETQESPKLASPPTAAPHSASPAQSREAWWAAGASIGLAGGVAPSPSLAEGAFLELGRGRTPGWSAHVRLAGLHAHGSEAARSGSAGFDLLALRVASCPYRLGARVVLSGCLSFDWGRLRGSGSRVLSAHATSARWLGPGGFLNAAMHVLPWLRLQLELGALLPLARDSFYFAPNETVHRIPDLAGYGGLNVLVGG
jgi:hypothetical protein